MILTKNFENSKYININKYNLYYYDYIMILIKKFKIYFYKLYIVLAI